MSLGFPGMEKGYTLCVLFWGLGKVGDLRILCVWREGIDTVGVERAGS